MARRNKRKNSIGCLFWIALILLILVIFLFNRETIQNVLNETGFLEVLQREKSEPEVERLETPDGSDEQGDPTDSIQVEITPPEDPAPDEDTIALEVNPAETAEETPDKEIPEAPQKVRRSKLYFVEINSDGTITQKEIVRPVYYLDSPLTATINTLLEGLSSSELNMGLISLIPEQSKLLSVNIKNGTAFLNFSEGFRFNSFGLEGYNAQLKQIVYTATEFSNIDSVQFMIEGKIKEYMGTEGGYIGSPLSRSDFP
jgi:spore germination protein GerM